MSRPTIIILGAAGFIGSWLRRRLIGHYRLISLDRQPLAPLDDAPGWRGPVEERRAQVDLGESDAVDAWWASQGDWIPDVVGLVNLAAYYDFSNRPSPEYERLHRGLAHVVELVARDLPSGAVFVQASSLATLRPTKPGHPLSADSPTGSRWRYPRWKTAADKLLDESGLEQAVIQLVLAAVYSDDGELVPLYEHIERVRRGGLMARVFPGDPSHGMTYVHVQDVCEAIVEALERFRDQGGRQRFLIGQPEPLAYETIQERAAELLHARSMPLRRAPKWLVIVVAAVTLFLGRLLGRPPFIRPWMVRLADDHYEIDLAGAREGLGWLPHRFLRGDLNVVLALARQDPARWHQINRRRHR